MEKQNLTQQKHAFTNQNKYTVIQHKINTKKLKPGLVASYHIRPENGEGLFSFWHFINLSLTYLLRHSDDYCAIFTNVAALFNRSVGPRTLALTSFLIHFQVFNDALLYFPLAVVSLRREYYKADRHKRRSLISAEDRTRQQIAIHEAAKHRIEDS